MSVTWSRVRFVTVRCVSLLRRRLCRPESTCRHVGLLYAPQCFTAPSLIHWRTNRWLDALVAKASTPVVCVLCILSSILDFIAVIISQWTKHLYRNAYLYVMRTNQRHISFSFCCCFISLCGNLYVLLQYNMWWLNKWLIRLIDWLVSLIVHGYTVQKMLTPKVNFWLFDRLYFHGLDAVIHKIFS